VSITPDVVSSNLDQGEVLLDTTLVTSQWFSPGSPVSPTNKTDRHDIAEILLKVALNTIKQKQNYLPLQLNFQINIDKIL